MKLIFMLRTAIDTHSVINRTCATCKHLYVDPIDEWTTCELKFAINDPFHIIGCPKYIYLRSPKKL